MLATLDTLARRYGTDPWSVLEWHPARLRLASECLRNAEVELTQEIRAAAAVPPGMIPSIVNVRVLGG